MIKLVLENPFAFQWRTEEDLPILQSNDVLVKIKTIGICGTDYHAFRGKQPFFSYPRVLGHELGGEVVKMGNNTEGVSLGDKVAIEPYLNCGKCQTGNPNSMKNAFNYVSFGGKLVFVGLFIGDIAFNDPLFHRREMTLFASRNSLPQDFSNIIKLMEIGKIDTTPWLTHRADFDALPHVFTDWLDPNSGVIKAIVSL